MEEFKHPCEVSVGGAEEDIIEKVAPEGVCREYGGGANTGTDMTLAVEEAAPKTMYAVNEEPVREIMIQRYHDVSAISKPALVLEVGLFFPAHL